MYPSPNSSGHPIDRSGRLSSPLYAPVANAFAKSRAEPRLLWWVASVHNALPAIRLPRAPTDEWLDLVRVAINRADAIVSAGPMPQLLRRLRGRGPAW